MLCVRSVPRPGPGFVRPLTSPMATSTRAAWLGTNTGITNTVGPRSKPACIRSTIHTPGRTESSRSRTILVCAGEQAHSCKTCETERREDLTQLVFRDSFVRTFLLGVAVGGCLEAGHVLYELALLSGNTSDVWSAAALTPAAGPQPVPDHIVAVGAWILLYVLDSSLILKARVLYANNALGLTEYMSKLPSQAMLPLKQSIFKTIWVNLGIRKRFLQTQAEENSTEAVETPEAPSSLAWLDSPQNGFTAPPQAPTNGVVQPTQQRKAPRMPQPSRKPRSMNPPPTTSTVPTKAPREGLKPGEWDPNQGKEAIRHRDKIARESYLKDFYYCLGADSLEALPVGKLQQADVMGRSVAYWRGTGNKVQAIANICAHRGAQLANGWLSQVDGVECVRCPYHAWAFSGDGVVKDIPVQPDGNYPKQALQQPYDVVSDKGSLWLFWGSRKLPAEERLPPPGSLHISEDVLPTRVELEHLSPHWSVLESMVSKEFIANVATSLLGFSYAVVSSSQSMERDTTSVSTTHFMTYKPSPRTLLLFGNLPSTIGVTITCFLPSSVTVSFDLGDGKFLSLDAHVRPSQYDTSSVHYVLHENCSSLANFDFVARETLRTFAEGTRSREEGTIVRSTRRKPPNKLLTAFSALRQELVSLGFAVPPEVSLQRAGRSDM